VDDCVAGPMELFMVAGPAVASERSLTLTSRPRRHSAGTILFVIAARCTFPARGGGRAAVLRLITHSFCRPGHHHFLATLKTSGPQTHYGLRRDYKGSQYDNLAKRRHAEHFRNSHLALSRRGHGRGAGQCRGLQAGSFRCSANQLQRKGAFHQQRRRRGSSAGHETGETEPAALGVTFNNAGTQSLQVADAAMPAISKSPM